MFKTFRKMVDGHRHRVFTLALYNLGNREEAEDVTQEVLVRLWRCLDDVDERSLAPWLARVTRNACIDAIRRRAAYAARVVAAGEETWETASGGALPDQEVESSELRSHIRGALARLREPYRSIVIMREIQNLKYEEISESMELPLNTIKSYLHRGRQMLRDELRDVIGNESVSR